MWRSPAVSYLIGRLTRVGVASVQSPSSYNTMVHVQICKRNTTTSTSQLEDHFDNKAMCGNSYQNAGGVQKHQIGKNVSRKDKINFLINTLLDIKDSKEDVYGALDAWVAWEHKFPIASLKRALLTLEKEQQWRRVVQLFKGLEAFHRKPPEKLIVQKVANVYEILGMLEEKERVLQKYINLFTKTNEGDLKKSRNTFKKKSGQRKYKSKSKAYTNNICSNVKGYQM